MPEGARSPPWSGTMTAACYARGAVERHVALAERVQQGVPIFIVHPAHDNRGVVENLPEVRGPGLLTLAKIAERAAATRHESQAASLSQRPHIVPEVTSNRRR